MITPCPIPELARPRPARSCYIARYPLDAKGDDLEEQILFRDHYWSPALSAEWDRLVAERIARIPAGQRASAEPMLQAWYLDENAVECVAQTNQPIRLP